MIRNVVFDVGGVLVRLRYQPFIDYLASAGVDMTDLPAWLERVDLSAHERGEITGDELLGRVAAIARRVSDIAAVPSRGWVGRVLPWVIPAALVALFVAGFFKSGLSMSLEMALKWLVANGGLAALG